MPLHLRTTRPQPRRLVPAEQPPAGECPHPPCRVREHVGDWSRRIQRHYLILHRNRPGHPVRDRVVSRCRGDEGRGDSPAAIALVGLKVTVEIQKPVHSILELTIRAPAIRQIKLSKLSTRERASGSSSGVMPLPSRMSRRRRAPGLMQAHHPPLPSIRRPVLLPWLLPRSTMTIPYLRFVVRPANVPGAQDHGRACWGPSRPGL